MAIMEVTEIMAAALEQVMAEASVRVISVVIYGVPIPAANVWEGI